CERVMAEVDALLVLVPLVEREIDNPAQFETFSVDETEFLTRPRTRRTGKARELRRISGGEETRISGLQAKLPTNGLGPFLANILRDRPRPLGLAAFLTPENIAQSRLTLAL